MSDSRTPGLSPYGEPALSALVSLLYAVRTRTLAAQGILSTLARQLSVRPTVRSPTLQEGSLPMTSYRDFHRRSIENPEDFWRDEARRIHWETPFHTVLDTSNPPFARWFVGGRTNLCHNAVDRHLVERAQQNALVYVSTETGIERRYTYAELYAEINRMAAVMRSLGVKRGERVLIYLPMIPEAVFAMLACARLGAIHSVVFGGFAAPNLAARIDDAKPALIVTADAGARGGKVIDYTPLVDEALARAQHKTPHVLLIDRQLAPERLNASYLVAYEPLREQFFNAHVPCEWLESNEPSYVLYTSGTTGRPKGVQRDVGGYAVALAASMEYIFEGRAGDTMFTASDIGWVVGHSYIIYAPLIAGLTTVMYEGTPIRPDGGIWWRLVEQHKINLMFTAPTALRVLKKQDPALLKKSNLSSLRALFLAGEPLDEPTASWIAGALGKPVVDNYWQTETGWPMLAIQRGVEALPHQARLAWRARLRLQPDAAQRKHRRGLRARRERRDHARLSASAWLHVDGMGRRSALCQHVLVERAGPAGLFDFRLGHSG